MPSLPVPDSIMQTAVSPRSSASELKRASSGGLRPRASTGISNPLTPAIPTSTVIKIVASSGACNASTVPASNLAHGLLAWGTTLHAKPTAPVSFGVTEAPFSKSDLSAAELAHITTTCGFIQSNGSGFGICKLMQARMSAAMRRMSSTGRWASSTSLSA